LKNCHQNAGHEIDQFGSSRHFDGREFLFGSGQVQELQLQHRDLPCIRQQTFAEGYR
jgi:hypothetical protein